MCGDRFPAPMVIASNPGIRPSGPLAATLLQSALRWRDPKTGLLIDEADRTGPLRSASSISRPVFGSRHRSADCNNVAASGPLGLMPGFDAITIGAGNRSPHIGKEFAQRVGLLIEKFVVHHCKQSLRAR